MNKAEFNNAFRAEVFDLPNVPGILADFDNDKDDRGIRMALTTPEHFAPRAVLLMGCGDSYCAGLAAEPVFNELGGVRTKAVSALELARHYPAKALGGEPMNPMVFAISASGTPTRVVEAVKRANAIGVGAFTVAVTTNPESPLAAECDRTIKVKTPAFANPFPEQHSPGTRSYFASMWVLFQEAIRMGEVKMHYPMTQGMDYRNSMTEYAKSFEPVLENIDNQMFELAEKWKDLSRFEFVGAGPSGMATAWFGAAKVYEASGDPSTYENVEDWCHINYFAKDPQTIGTVMIIEAGSKSFKRAAEVVEVMAHHLGRPTLVVTDAPASEFCKEAVVCTIPSPKYVWQAPLMNHVPIDLLSGYLCMIKGEPMFRDRTKPPFNAPEGSMIKSSKMEIVR